MKLRTPHNETHCICTNYGMAFTKDGQPGDTKFAMIDRSIAHLVRSIGKNSHPDSEFHAHMARPEIQDKLTKLRMFISLVGATKLAIMGVPSFQPNLALANKMFDYMDNEVVVGEYNLPRRAPRKCLKRDENLRTLSIMSAVCNVFMYKQTAVEWEAGKLGEDGKPQPFRWTQLYDVIRQLHPSPEQIFMAWSQSLDYNIGTASHTFAAMTALCESFGVRVGDWLKKPPADCHTVRQSGDLRSPSFGANIKPQRQPGQSDEEYDSEVQTWKNMVKQMEQTEAHEDVFTNFLSDGGGDRQECLDMLSGLTRQRRATAQYRHRCGQDGNSELVMDSPLELINKIMATKPIPPDATGVAAAGGSNDDQCMPLYPSCIIASCVQISSLYNPQALVQWSTSGTATPSEVGTCITAGTGQDILFRTKQGSGALRWDTAWMRAPFPVTRIENYARRIRDQNHTCKIFDLPFNGLRDMLFLLTTKDNNRRITEEPAVTSRISASKAFMQPNGQAINDSSHFVKMRGMYDSRVNGEVNYAEAPERHPYSCVSRVPLQRRIDFAINAGRYPAVMPLISNKTTNEAPVRFVEDRGGEKGDKYVELNTAAAFDHTKMMAEAILRCSVHAGMEGTQERFCDDMQGPNGLVASVPDASAPNGIRTTKLPYSYDIPSIAITLDVMSRYYDPHAAGYLKMYNDAYGDMGFKIKQQDLPHMCLRFVGFPEENRLLLSCKVPFSRNPIFEDVEAGDAFMDKDIEPVTRSLVSLSLGHNASDEEVEQYMRSMAGSRNMSGVSGPLFSLETWLKHTATALKERGMVSHEYDVPIQSVYDEPYGLRMRLYELASIKINELVDAHDDIQESQQPRHGDAGIPAERLRMLVKERLEAARHKLYKTIDLEPALDALRFCGPLGIRQNRMCKLTYDNCKRQQTTAKKAAKRNARNITDATSVSDVKKMAKGLMPGGGALRPRGREDSRRRG